MDRLKQKVLETGSILTIILLPINWGSQKKTIKFPMI